MKDQLIVSHGNQDKARHDENDSFDAGLYVGTGLDSSHVTALDECHGQADKQEHFALLDA